MVTPQLLDSQPEAFDLRLRASVRAIPRSVFRLSRRAGISEFGSIASIVSKIFHAFDQATASVGIPCSSSRHFERAPETFGLSPIADVAALRRALHERSWPLACGLVVGVVVRCTPQTSHFWNAIVFVRYSQATAGASLQTIKTSRSSASTRFLRRYFRSGRHHQFDATLL